MGDHPPITPTVNFPRSLPGSEEKMYEYISKHYLASISQDA
jgi:DNA topoisomerase IA